MDPRDRFEKGRNRRRVLLFLLLLFLVLVGAGVGGRPDPGAGAMGGAGGHQYGAGGEAGGVGWESKRRKGGKGVSSTAYLVQALIGLVILLGAVLALVNHRARKRKQESTNHGDAGGDGAQPLRFRPNVEGIWEDCRKLGLALLVASLVGGFLQEQIPPVSTFGGTIASLLFWGVGILFGGER